MPYKKMNKALVTGIAILAVLGAGTAAYSFCGFYVAKADTKMFNKASKVAIVRDADRTVITMANDYQGTLTEFAMVIPVPTVLQEGQIHVTQNAILDHLDHYSAPRLVEYFDVNPCQAPKFYKSLTMQNLSENDQINSPVPAGQLDLGVTIEAEYTVGEYDILILSAKQSDGLATWLTQNGYKIPDGAEKTLDSYIRQGTKFFVAKVNLKEQARTGLTFLRPLQIAFESPKFMLPIRLGMANADGKQELFIFALTREGRVETTNYRTVKLPTNIDVPLYVKDDFSPFYKSMFERSVLRENERAVFMEYAWDMNWCDPCAADPLSDAELRELGVFWLDETQSVDRRQSRSFTPRAKDVFITRLHVSYDAEHFPEDLKFKTTGDRSNFQGRYVLNHPYKGEAECPQADTYRASLPDRFEKEAQNLARLTGWDIQDVRDRMAQTGQQGTLTPQEPSDEKPVTWWQRLWKR